MKKNNKFTMVELIVVITIITILASMLLPALTKARNNARSLSCKNNLKTWGRGMALYTNDFNSYFPYAHHTLCGNSSFYVWNYTIGLSLGYADDYTKNLRQANKIGCPLYNRTTADINQIGYAMNIHVSTANSSSIKTPSMTMLMTEYYGRTCTGQGDIETSSVFNNPSADIPVASSGFWHNRASNNIFADYHCAEVKYSNYPKPHDVYWLPQ